MKNLPLNTNIVITELRHRGHKIYKDIVNEIVEFYNYNDKYTNIIDYIKDLFYILNDCNKNIDHMTRAQLIDYLFELL